MLEQSWDLTADFPAIINAGPNSLCWDFPRNLRRHTRRAPRPRVMPWCAWSRTGSCLSAGAVFALRERVPSQPGPGASAARHPGVPCLLLRRAWSTALTCLSPRALFALEAIVSSRDGSQCGSCPTSLACPQARLCPSSACRLFQQKPATLAAILLQQKICEGSHRLLYHVGIA
jgi:hypothetical protein